MPCQPPNTPDELSTVSSTSKWTLFGGLFGARPQAIAEHHKELRFTRNHQASHLFLLTAFLLMIGIGSFIALLSCWGSEDPDFPRYAWLCLLPALPAYFSLRAAIYCIRHAYLLLTPLGIEIFPFFNPQKNLQVVFWAEIASASISSTHLTLHTSKNKTSGLVLSLNPLNKQQISLLQTAINSRTSPQ